MCKEMLQKQVDKIVDSFNNAMAGLDYDEIYQEFSMDPSEKEWILMLFGMKECMRELDDDLDWSKLDDRWDHLEMSAFEEV